MNTSKDKPAPRGARTPPSIPDRARQIALDVARVGRVPGMSFAVAGPEGVLHADAVGFADLASRRPSTVDDYYPWFSMTKIATATAAMRLHADGLLDLDAPIGRYLPGYRPDAKRGHPTTRQLLTHTAGLANPMPIRWVRPESQPEDPALVERLVAKYGSPRKTVGARAAYSNIGYLLVGEVLESVTGRRVQDCVSDAVLRPLGMNGTGYGFQNHVPRSVGYIRINFVLSPMLRWALPGGLVGARVDGHTALKPFLVSGAAYGGLVGGVTEAARLAATHAAGVSDAHPVLDHTDIQAMRTITATGKTFDHGIGWFRKPVDAERSPAFVEHYGTGGGYWNAMRIYPEQRLAMVAMANTTFKWDVDRMFTQLMELKWH